MPRQVTWKISPTGYAFLTYSQAPDNFESAIQDALRNLGSGDLVIGHERHEDGGHHYHVMVGWPTGYETRDPTSFDVAGYHPNYKGIRGRGNIERVYNYCVKDGNTTGGFEVTRSVKPTRNEVWSNYLAADNEREFFERLRAGAAYEYILNYDRLSSFARAHFDQSKKYVPEHTHFVVPESLQSWVNTVSGGLATLLGLASG
jgi:hypothetical protein